jgi:UDP-3-O-[3-hydroxymyristoyl] glucosamine N-acyltransferase LpxD
MLYSNQFIFEIAALKPVFSSENTGNAFSSAWAAENNAALDKNYTLHKAATISNAASGSLMFIKKWQPEIPNLLAQVSHALIFIDGSLPEIALIPLSVFENNAVLKSENARLDFFIALNHIFQTGRDAFSEARFIEKNGSFISETAKIGQNVTIDPQVFIGHNVEIGDHCHLKSGVKIEGNVRIGHHTVVGFNTCLGVQGFGAERLSDDTDKVLMVPHLGGLQIGSYVRIGSLTSICAGTIEPTRIEDHAKIDDLVHIAHNCIIGGGAYIIGNAELCGSVEIGRKTWVGPNSSVLQGVKVGAGATLGLGAVVTRDVADGQTVAGNHALDIVDFGKVRNFLRKAIAPKLK